MRWTKSIIKGLPMSSESLEAIRQLAFLLVNRTEYVDYKIEMTVNSRLPPLVQDQAQVRAAL
jgi:hypothetical protein